MTGILIISSLFKMKFRYMDENYEKQHFRFTLVNTIPVHKKCRFKMDNIFLISL